MCFSIFIIFLLKILCKWGNWTYASLTKPGHWRYCNEKVNAFANLVIMVRMARVISSCVIFILPRFIVKGCIFQCHRNCEFDLDQAGKEIFWLSPSQTRGWPSLPLSTWVWLAINHKSNSSCWFFPYQNFCTCVFLYIFVLAEFFLIWAKLLALLPCWVFPDSEYVNLGIL